MCAPTESNSTEERRVIISGAGPAGLLMASLLLARNKETESSSVTYKVTLIDGRQDYGALSMEELCAHHRSWMIGLSDHGLDAIRTIPDLFENYMKDEGILVKELNIYLGKKKISQVADTSKMQNTLRRGKGEPPEGKIVDRNFIVAAIARYIRDNHQNDDNYTALYQHKCQYVDYDKKQVLVRNVETQAETYVPYDLLIGCDGIRSTVREALVKRHANFSCLVTDIFQEFKPTHIERPEEISENSMTILPDIFPYFQGIALPETGGKVNLSMGVPRNNFDLIPEELKSSDYKVVADYARKNFKAFKLVDYDDWAKQWVDIPWRQTGMVHCNFYHSLQTGIVIMGDAAHATSPSIGQGMNTALRDAQIFQEILKESKDDLSKALPAFSEARVKEGNSLTYLSKNLNCLDSKQQLKETLHLGIRGFLSSKFPSLVDEHPQMMIGRRGVSLSEVYEVAVKQGIIRKQKSINDTIQLEYFEQETGMMKQPSSTSKPFASKIIVGAGLVAVSATMYQLSQNIS